MTRFFRMTAALCALALAAALVGGITPRPASAGAPAVAGTGAQDAERRGGRPHSLTAVGDTLFFLTQRETAPARNLCSNELWKSDGTGDGTMMVKDLPRMNCGDTPDWLTDVDGTLFFVAGEGSPVELWKSDGTEDGTVMVKEVRGSSLINVGGTVFFSGFDPSHGTELWKSDGTEEGTEMVKDIDPDGSSRPMRLTDVDGTVFFSADDGIHGAELWRSDGTEQGTEMVKDINPGSESSNPLHLTDVDGPLFFSADDGVHGRELWKSDGTEEGTVLVKDINPEDRAVPRGLTDVAGTLFFVADDGTGARMWTSDGTEEGTAMVRDDITPFSRPSMPFFTAVDDAAFFVADDGIHGRELWKSDGTEEGTEMVKDISPSGSSTPNQLTNVAGTLFFTAPGGLWKSDGTEEGTVVVKAIGPSRWLTAVAGTLFFTVDNRELWKSDGSEEGTVMVRDINPTPPPEIQDRTIGLGPRLLRNWGVAQGRVRLADPDSRRLRCFRGPPGQPGGWPGVLVRIQRRPLVGGAWRTIRTPRTDRRGVYRAPRRILRPDGQPRPGRYRAVTPRFTFTAFDGVELTCLRAVSPVRRVPRR